MATKIVAVTTPEAPAPLPQFSQAVKYNGMVYCSGNIGALPTADFQMVEGTIKDRTVSVFSTTSNSGGPILCVGKSLTMLYHSDKYFATSLPSSMLRGAAFAT
jgi:hypothetical protein